MKRLTSGISARTKVGDLEQICTIPYDYKDIKIPLTYVPIIPSKNNINPDWRWRVFLGSRFCGEYTVWRAHLWDRNNNPPPRAPPNLSTIYHRIESWRKFDTKKVSRTLNMLEYGSGRYKKPELIKAIETHCGITLQEEKQQ